MGKSKHQLVKEVINITNKLKSKDITFEINIPANEKFKEHSGSIGLILGGKGCLGMGIFNRFGLEFGELEDIYQMLGEFFILNSEYEREKNIELIKEKRQNTIGDILSN